MRALCAIILLLSMVFPGFTRVSGAVPQAACEERCSCCPVGACPCADSGEDGESLPVPLIPQRQQGIGELYLFSKPVSDVAPLFQVQTPVPVVVAQPVVVSQYHFTPSYVRFCSRLR